MARRKLILICRPGGEFETNEEGTLSYTEGEPNALTISDETQFEDLKLKLAEMCNLDYNSVSINYILPGNKRSLIILNNGKDLKSLINFDGNSLTADIFVSGRKGFNRDALKICAGRESDIKVSETVNRVVSPILPNRSTPVDDANCAGCNELPSGCSSPATPASRVDSVIAVDATAQIPTGTAADSTQFSDYGSDDDSNYGPCSIVADDAIPDGPAGSDDSSTSSDLIKKRRHTDSSNVVGANVPTIVAVADDTQDGRSPKRTRQSHCSVAVADVLGCKQVITPRKNDFDSLSSNGISFDDLPKKRVVLWKDSITGVGQPFSSVKEFQDALQKYAIAHRFVHWLKKNDPSRASGRCVAKGCSWRIDASWIPTQSFQTILFNNSHTCKGESLESAHPGKKWMVGIIKAHLRDSPHQNPKEIVNYILRNCGLELSCAGVWNGIEDIREQLEGSYNEAYTSYKKEYNNEAYGQLPCFCDKLVETNPGSLTKLVTNDANRFQRLFVSFHATIHGFLSSRRPLLFLEATSFKSDYKETLFTATTVDGDDGLFPVAFAVIDVENGDNWHWFLEQLKSAMPTSQTITFVSDREKNLKKAVLEVFENAHHGYSIHHLIESFKANLKGPFHGDEKGSLPGYFTAAAHAIRFSIFTKYLENIKQFSCEAYNWVKQIEPEHWTSLFFKGEPYYHITRDVGESYIKLIEEMKEFTIIEKIEALICMMSDLIYKRQMESSKWSAKLTPSIEKKLQDLQAHDLKVFISPDSLFEVHDDSVHIVDISNWDCSCLEWTRNGLPCCHAIAVFKCTHRNVYDYCPINFTVDNFRLTYSEHINPVPSIGMPVEKEVADLDTATVLPPCPSRQLSHENEQTKTEYGNEAMVSCSRCMAAGYDKSAHKAVEVQLHEVDNAGSSHGNQKVVQLQPCKMDNTGSRHYNRGRCATLQSRECSF